MTDGRHHRDTRTRRLRRGALAVLSAGALTAGLMPQAVAEPIASTTVQTPGEAYEAMGFGVFMHYGLATFVGQTPWNYQPEDVPATTYDPANLDVDQWMDAVAAAGASYVIFTAKHHDGFTLWPSDYTDYGVQTSSDPRTDVVGEVVDAARERGLEVVMYYSWYDRLQPGGDVRPENSDRTTDSPEYMQYVKNQLTELLTEYGPIAGIWMDIAPMDDVQLPELSDFVHSVSPGTAFVPNFPNAQVEFDAADVRTFEGPYEMMPCDYADPKPTEQAYTVAAGPGWWQVSDDALPTRDTDAVYAVLSSTNALGATFSLNVSPGPSGQLPAGGVRLLEALGDRRRGDDLLAGAATTAGGETGDHPAAHATDLQAKTHWQVPADGESAWLQVNLGQELTIDRTALQVTAADAVAGYRIEYRDADGSWRTAHTGGAPAYPTQRDEFPAVTTDSLRLVVADATDGAGVIEFKAYGGLDDTADAVRYDGTGWQAQARPADAPQVPRLPSSVPFAGAFNTSIHRSRTAGDTATIEFSGTGAELRAGVGPDHGIARVSIDGGEPQTVDLYRAEAARDVAVLERRDLAPGEHTLTIDVTGDRHPDSTGAWVTLDRLVPLVLPVADDEDRPPYDELPDGRRIYDDGGDRCGADLPIEYVDTWEAGTWAGAYADTRHYSRTPGAYAELTFEGTGVAVMAQQRPGHGIAAISVDGGPAELVDTYSATAREQVIVWAASGLEPGQHTVRVTVTGDRNPAATNSWVGLDAIVVTP
ncbi:alpha-L-fucosidase [Jiangella asiatica]|nr:alpha-L-fucosidase [Jiangella asiatica]